MLEKILTELEPKEVTLVAVSKMKPISAIEEMYGRGQRIFGENRPKEMAEKYEALPKDIEWHMIGNLQRKSVKYIAPFVHTIHSVADLNLLVEISKQAVKNDREINCLLQFHIAEESSKSGFESVEELTVQLDNYKHFLEKEGKNIFPNVRLTGVMGMATFTDDKEQVRAEFKKLKSIFDVLKAKYFSEDAAFSTISMGMSGDYQLAVEEGSTMVRIGSLLFGGR